MLKKIMSLLIICILLFNFTASGTVISDAKTNLDAQLRNMNVPEHLIQDMPMEQKEDIIKHTKGYVTTIYPSNTENNGDISIMGGTIPTSDFSFYASVFRTGDTFDGRESFTIFVNYKWIKNPSPRGMDPYGVAWDDTKWRVVPNSYFNIDYAYSEALDQEIHESHTDLAYASSCGVGWNADLDPGPYYDTKWWNHGYGRVDIASQTPGPISGSDILCINYAHVYGITGTIGLSFSKISVSYSGSSSANTRGDYAYFQY